jgi:hypothetical protein
VRGDDESGVLTARDRNGEGRREAASGSASVDDLPDCADVNGVALEGFDEGLLELSAAGGVEKLQKPNGGAADIVAALGDNPEERLTATRGSS